MGLTANLYSAAKDYFLFGQTKFFTGTTAGAVTLSTPDTNAKTLNNIAPSTNWDYCPDATVTWSIVATSNPTTAEWANLDTTCPPTYNNPRTLTPGTADDGTDGSAHPAPTLAAAAWATKKNLKLVVIWANPDASCPSICYDGLAAQVV